MDANLRVNGYHPNPIFCTESINQYFRYVIGDAP
jgi:hypothetical protein